MRAPRSPCAPIAQDHNSRAPGLAAARRAGRFFENIAAGRLPRASVGSPTPWPGPSAPDATAASTALGGTLIPRLHRVLLRQPLHRRLVLVVQALGYHDLDHDVLVAL